MEQAQRVRPLLVLLVIALAARSPVTGEASAVPGTDQAGAELDTLARELHARLNQERAAAGVPEIALSDEATVVAGARSSDMAAADYFAHVSPSGIDAAFLLREHGVGYRLLGENIARCGHPPESMVDVVHSTLMISEGHRANILDAGFGRVGIGIARSGSMFYVTFLFLD